MYFVYVLLSLKDGRFYIGMTDDLDRRVEEHNSGKSRSTRNRRPFVLVYSEQCDSRLMASKREKFLKSGPGHRFLKRTLLITELVDAARKEPSG
jgi:putative endonuclease